MRRTIGWRIGLPSAVALTPTAAHAHSLATPYALPVPFWMYLYGCAATLIVTFAVLGYFWGAAARKERVRVWDISAGKAVRMAAWCGLQLLRVVALSWLLLVVISGFIGTPDPGRNINMTLFWVVFLLGFTYLTVLVGDLYALINPWKTIVRCLQAVGVTAGRPRLSYPPALGYWPAFALYVALIWLELFALPKPFVLSVAVLLYSTVTVLGVILFGSDLWFRQCDVFSVFFRMVAMLAPVEYVPTPDGRSVRVRLRAPFMAGVNDKPEHMTLVLFILFMLSSTTYDALHQTVLWMEMYWRPLVALLESVWDMNAAGIQKMLMGGYLVYLRGGLVLSASLYLGVYLIVLWWAKRASRVACSVPVLARTFAYSLVPIAIAYHLTHYYPMLIMESRDLPWLFTDPFGLGWNLLALAPPLFEPPPLPMAIVWHTQVGILLIGHVVSVYQSHIIAIQTFDTRRQIVMSQLPLLVLMMAYTAIGLWILSLPLSA